MKNSGRVKRITWENFCPNIPTPFSLSLFPPNIPPPPLTIPFPPGFQPGFWKCESKFYGAAGTMLLGVSGGILPQKILKNCSLLDVISVILTAVNIFQLNYSTAVCPWLFYKTILSATYLVWHWIKLYLGQKTPVVINSDWNLKLSSHELTRTDTNLAPGKVAWGQLGKSISLNSSVACEIASLNFDSCDQNRKETR